MCIRDRSNAVHLAPEGEEVLDGLPFVVGVRALAAVQQHSCGFPVVRHTSAMRGVVERGDPLHLDSDEELPDRHLKGGRDTGDRGHRRVSGPVVVDCAGSPTGFQELHLVLRYPGHVCEFLLREIMRLTHRSQFGAETPRSFLVPHLLDFEG